MPREHGKDGTYVETVSLEDVRNVFDAVDGPVILSADVADQLDCSRETARRKLEELHDRGELARRKVSRRVIYWEGDDTDTRDAHGAGAPTPGENTPDDTNAESGRTRDENGALAEDVRTYLEENDVPPKTEHGRSAVVDVFRHLRSNGASKTGEIQEAIYPDYPDEWGSARSMWESIKRGFEDVPGIEKGGYGEWTYTGDESVRDQLNGEESGIYDPTEEF